MSHQSSEQLGFDIRNRLYHMELYISKLIVFLNDSSLCGFCLQPSQASYHMVASQDRAPTVKPFKSIGIKC